MVNIDFTPIQPETVLKNELQKLNTEFADVKNEQKDLQHVYKSSVPSYLQENMFNLDESDYQAFKKRHMF